MQLINNDKEKIDYNKVERYIRNITEKNKINTINDYNKKLDILIDEEKKTNESLLDNSITLSLVKEELKKYVNIIGTYEETLSNIDNPTIKTKLLLANKWFRDIQFSYMEKSFDEYNTKIDNNIKETQESTSSLLFNVISIFLGISTTSAMITGFVNIEPKFTLFYFLSCGWMALTIITIAALYLKSLDKKISIILSIYIVFSILWILIGIGSYKMYSKDNPKDPPCEETVIKETIKDNGQKNTNNN